ncbi:MAG: hypothetical protein FJZ63_02915, partial [Chlamydiae bacterium]|nr:hypothetical protein [Chlamydiota bacterium]
MTDSSAGFKNSKNNLPKGFAGSLTLRIFFTVLVFLIIPLWVYALLMYRYNKELDGVRQGRSLQLISEIQILGFEKLEYEMQEILDLLKLDAQDFSSAKMDKTSFQKRLDRAAQFEGVGRVVFLSKGEGGELQCVLSSPSCEGVEDFSTLFFSEKLQSNDELSSLIDKGNRLAFIKVVARGAQGAPLSALVLDMATETLMRMLTQAQGYAGGYSIALFSQDSYHILSSQDSNLMGKTLVFKPASAEGELFLERLFGIQDTYSYKIDKNTLYATLLEVADHSFGILVSASYYK